jgi:hypothetical protein
MDQNYHAAHRWVLRFVMPPAAMALYWKLMPGTETTFD